MLANSIKTTDEPITSILVPYPDGTTKYLYINGNDEITVKTGDKETIYHYNEDTDSFETEELTKDEKNKEERQKEKYIMFSYEDYKKSADYIKERLDGSIPKIAIILGSGLGVLSEEIENKRVIKYKEIPNFPISTVEGHAGELIIGKLSGEDLIAMNGRFHYYEGYDVKEVTFPIRVFKLLGVETLILTNASGGINSNYKAGDFMVINDYLSFFADSVLRGPNLNEFGERFSDMSETFDKQLSKKLKEIVQKHTGRAQEGVYAYMKGPTFETPAEIRALRTLGADAVGLSTVPEAVVAHHANMKTVGISCITNMAAGVLDEKLSYDDVKNTAEKVKIKFKEIIKEFIETT